MSCQLQSKTAAETPNFHAGAIYRHKGNVLPPPPSLVDILPILFIRSTQELSFYWNAGK